MTCEHCTQRPVQRNGVTCGNSWCQEARYLRGKARLARGARRQKLIERARQCEINARSQVTDIDNIGGAS